MLDHSALENRLFAPDIFGLPVDHPKEYGQSLENLYLFDTTATVQPDDNRSLLTAAPAITTRRRAYTKGETKNTRGTDKNAKGTSPNANTNKTAGANKNANRATTVA